MQDSLETQVKHLIVEALALEDISPNDIETDAPLFVEGLGLDSIDALELALAIHEKFGVKTSAEDEKNRQNFHSVKTLAEFIRQETAKKAAASATAAESSASEKEGEAVREKADVKVSDQGTGEAPNDP